jgi:FkbM family methyltransferase
VNVRSLARALLPRGARNWLRSPAMSAAWVADEARHALGFDPAVPLRPGWSPRCHPAALRLAFWPALADGDQARELDGFIVACGPGMRFLDVGAHFGLFSLAALHYGGLEAVVIAVDPSPTAARILRLHARLNGVERRLTVVEAALADRAGRVDLVSVGVIAAGYYARPAADHGAGETTSVEALTLDALAERHGMTPTHIKIDVEGFEAQVLAGARTVLAASHPLLFVELHNEMVRRRGLDPGATLDQLAAAGYALCDPDGRPVGAREILSRPLTRIVARWPAP